MTSKKNTTASNLATQVKKVGTRAVKIVTKAAGHGDWTIDAISQAATWLETGAKVGGLQRPWLQLAAQLRTIAKRATASATSKVINTTGVVTTTTDESTPAAEPAPVAATRAPRRARTTKPLPAAVEPHTEVGDDTTHGGATLRDLKQQFLQHLEAIGKSRGTVFSYELDIGVAERYFSTARNIHTLTSQDISAYYNSDTVTKRKDGSPKSGITTAKLKRVFRQAIEFAVREGMIAKSPLPAEVKSEEVDSEAALTTSAS